MWHYVPKKVTAVKRMLFELSFIMSATLRAIFSKKPDIYVVVSPPLFAGIPISIVGKLRRVPVLFHIQDLQPDAAVWLGMLKPGLLTKILYALERLTYKMVDHISGITPAMVETIESKGISPDKISLLPNWINIRHDAPLPQRKQESGLAVRRKLGFADDTFLGVYSGNLGVKQGLEAIINAAEELKKANIPAKDVSLLICGDGTEKQRLVDIAKEKQLDNLFFQPLLAYDDYQGLLNSCDINLVTQVVGSGKAFFPSKVLSILAAACPVLAVSDPDSPLQQAITEGKAGFTASPEDTAGIAQLLIDLRSRTDELQQCSRDGFEWVKIFAPESVLNTFEKSIMVLGKHPDEVLIPLAMPELSRKFQANSPLIDYPTRAA